VRDAFAAAITALAAEDERVVLLSGDIGNRMFDRFKETAPERFINCGVAEANMMGLAAGLALDGMRPFVYTITPFVTTRCLEQIRVDVAYNDAPVAIVGVGSGLGYASLGATHHSCEDLAFLRAIPNMTVFAPADALEVRGGVDAAIRLDGPFYMRIGKKGEPVVHEQVPSMQPGGSLLVRPGRDVCILSVGVMLPSALAAAERLAADGIDCAVVSMYSVKPLDTAMLARVFDEVPLVVTLEEHSLAGGAGSAVAEWLVDRGDARARLVRLGTRDAFMHEAGGTAHARVWHGIGEDDVVLTVRAAAERIAAG